MRLHRRSWARTMAWHDEVLVVSRWAEAVVE
jgi:hypothetical protein